MSRVTYAVLALLLLGRCSVPSYGAGPAQCHAMTMEMDRRGGITLYSSYVRERTLEPRSEEELAAVIARQRVNPPVREGVVTVRGRDRWGRVIYRTLVTVPLIGETTCCPHVEFRIDPLAFSVIVPAAVTSVSFEGWQPASRTTIRIK